MGTLCSRTSEPTGYVCNGVLLGEPVEIDGNPDTFEWDDAAFPNGACHIQDGTLVVIPDEE